MNEPDLKMTVQLEVDDASIARGKKKVASSLGDFISQDIKYIKKFLLEYKHLGEQVVKVSEQLSGSWSNFEIGVRAIEKQIAPMKKLARAYNDAAIAADKLSTAQDRSDLAAVRAERRKLLIERTKTNNENDRLIQEKRIREIEARKIVLNTPPKQSQRAKTQALYNPVGALLGINGAGGYRGALVGGAFGGQAVATGVGALAGAAGMSATGVGAVVLGVQAIGAAIQIGIGLTKSWVEMWYDYRMTIERAKMSFEVLLGSQRTASEYVTTLIKDLQGLGDINSAVVLSKKLLNVGMSAYEAKSKVVELVQYFSASGLDANQQKGGTKALTDVATGGILRGQEVMQFTNAGIAIKRIIADYLNITQAEVTKRMKGHQITADIVFGAMSEEAARYKPQLEKLMLLPSTSIERIRRAWAASSDTIFSGYYESISQHLKQAADELDLVSSLSNAFEKLYDRFFLLGGELIGRMVAGMVDGIKNITWSDLFDSTGKMVTNLGLGALTGYTKQTQRIYEESQPQYEYLVKRSEQSTYTNSILKDPKLLYGAFPSDKDYRAKAIAENAKNTTTALAAVPQKLEMPKPFSIEDFNYRKQGRASFELKQVPMEKVERPAQPLSEEEITRQAALLRRRDERMRNDAMREARKQKKLVKPSKEFRAWDLESSEMLSDFYKDIDNYGGGGSGKKKKSEKDRLFESIAKLKAEITRMTTDSPLHPYEVIQEKLEREKNILNSIYNLQAELGMKLSKLPADETSQKALLEKLQDAQQVSQSIKDAKHEGKAAAVELAVAQETYNLPVISAEVKFQTEYLKVLKQRRVEEQELTKDLMLAAEKRQEIQDSAEGIARAEQMARATAAKDLIAQSIGATNDRNYAFAMKGLLFGDSSIGDVINEQAAMFSANTTPIEDIRKYVYEILQIAQGKSPNGSSSSNAKGDEPAWVASRKLVEEKFKEVINDPTKFSAMLEAMGANKFSTDIYNQENAGKMKEGEISARNSWLSKWSMGMPEEAKIVSNLIGNSKTEAISNSNFEVLTRYIELHGQLAVAEQKLADLRNTNSLQYLDTVMSANEQITNSHSETAQHIIQLQEQIRRAGENTADEYRESWLEAHEDVINRDKDAIKSQIRSQVELDQKFNFSASQARAAFMDAAASAKGYTEIFADGWIGVMDGMSSSLNNFLASSADKLGVVGKVIADIGSSLMAMVTNKLVMRLVDFFLDPDKSGKNTVSNTFASAGMNTGMGMVSSIFAPRGNGGSYGYGGGYSGGLGGMMPALSFAGIGGSGGSLGSQLLSGSGFSESMFSNLGGAGTLTNNSNRLSIVQGAGQAGAGVAKNLNLFGGMKDFWKTNKGAIAASLPFIGFGAGANLGGQSMLGQLLGGAGMAGLGMIASASMMGTATSTGMLGSLSIAGGLGAAGAATLVLAPLAIAGAIMLGKASQRKKDEAAAEPMWQQYRDTVEELSRRVKNGTLDGDDALAQAKKARDAAEKNIRDNIKTKSVRDSRINNQLRDVDTYYLSQLKKEIETQKKRRKEGALLLPEFATGGIIPGAFGSAQLVMAHGGELVVNPEQQTPDLLRAAWSAGVPGTERLTPSSGGGEQGQKIEVKLVMGTEAQDKLFVNGAKSSAGYKMIVGQIRNAMKYSDL